MAKLNRRNVLIGMGTIVAGGGAALGTGAFSQVEAERTMSIQTTGDGSALLQLSASTDDYSGVSDSMDGDVVQLTFSDLNADATTRFNGILTITNDGSNPVSLEASTTGDATFYYDADDSEDRETALSDTPVELTASDSSVVLDAEIDLTGQNSVDEDQEVTFTATDSS